MYVDLENSYLSEAFSLGMLLEAERREVDAGAEDLGLSQDRDTSDTINFHLHVGIAVGIAQVGQMRPPRGILGIALDDNGVLV